MECSQIPWHLARFPISERFRVIRDARAEPPGLALMGFAPLPLCAAYRHLVSEATLNYQASESKFALVYQGLPDQACLAAATSLLRSSLGQHPQDCQAFLPSAPCVPRGVQLPLESSAVGRQVAAPSVRVLGFDLALASVDLTAPPSGSTGLDFRRVAVTAASYFQSRWHPSAGSSVPLRQAVQRLLD